MKNLILRDSRRSRLAGDRSRRRQDNSAIEDPIRISGMTGTMVDGKYTRHSKAQVGPSGVGLLRSDMHFHFIVNSGSGQISAAQFENDQSVSELKSSEFFEQSELVGLVCETPLEDA
jgi:hypothetical protein